METLLTGYLDLHMGRLLIRARRMPMSPRLCLRHRLGHRLCRVVFADNLAERVQLRRRNGTNGSVAPSTRQGQSDMVMGVVGQIVRGS